MKRAVVVLLLLIANALFGSHKVGTADESPREMFVAQASRWSRCVRASRKGAADYDPRFQLRAPDAGQDAGLRRHRHPCARARDRREHDHLLVVNALLLRPLPLIQNQDRLIYLSQYFPKNGDDDDGIAFPDFLEFKKQATTLEGFGAWQDATFIITDGEKPARFLGAHISAELFRSLACSRFSAGTFARRKTTSMRRRSRSSAMTSGKLYSAATRPWSGGRFRSTAGRPPIIGVMPKSWRFPERNDIWMPLQIDEKDNARGNFILGGVGIAQEGRLDSTGAGGTRSHRAASRGASIRRPTRIERPHQDLARRDGGGSTKRSPCSSWARSFSSTSSPARTSPISSSPAVPPAQKKSAIRCALGASRGQIVRGLLAESVSC